MAKAEIIMVMADDPIKMFTTDAMIIAIRPMNMNCPMLSRLRLVKYPYMVMVPNNTAAPINALTIDPRPNTTKIMLKLTPIKAANRYSMILAMSGAMSRILNPNNKDMPSGAKITIHFITPVNKNCIKAGLLLTAMAMTPDTITAMHI